MKSCRPPLFWKRKFDPHVIVTCVRWYLRFCLSLRDLEELMAERGLAVDHTTIWRWAQRYGPEKLRRLGGEVKRKSSTWHMDVTFIRSPVHRCTSSGRWTATHRPRISTSWRRAIAKPPTSSCEGRYVGDSKAAKRGLR